MLLPRDDSRETIELGCIRRIRTQGGEKMARRRMVIYANFLADRSMGYERSIQRKGGLRSSSPRLRKQSRVKFRLMTE